jgi:hypothetical protein
MAKSEGFKNKITKAQEDLFKAIETEKTKKKALSEKIVNELSKLEKANVRTLNSLNKEYLEQCANNKAKLESFISEIENCTAILEDLKKKKETFQKKLITSMTANNVPTFTTNNNLKITYTPESHRENISKEKLKAYCDSNLIDISQFITVSNVKESVKITLLNNKGGNTNA